MEFPGDWTILDMEDFETASSPRNPGALGLDVLVQLRNSGRAMDDFRVLVGGSQRLKVGFEASSVFPTTTVPDWIISLECWPRDITLRKNMVSSEWMDVINMVAANDKAARHPMELRCTGPLEWVRTRSWNSLYSACPPLPPTWLENLPYRGKFLFVNLCDRGSKMLIKVK